MKQKRHTVRDKISLCTKGAWRYRRLGVEPLEDRRMLASVAVSNLLDLVNGDTSSIANLTADSGGDGISLREAILAANASGGLDNISFDSSLTSGGPAVISLSNLGQFEINDDLVITGPGANLVTVMAYDPTSTEKNGDGTRIFEVMESRTVGISGLTLNGGDVSGHGGAIFNRGDLTLTESVISGNTASGANVFSAEVSAEITAAYGGGIYSTGPLSVVDSTISGNSAIAKHLGITFTTHSRGGGIAAIGTLNLSGTTVYENSAVGERTYYNTIISTQGGGVWAAGASTITGSTITENSTIAGDTNDSNSDRAKGGGLAVGHAVITDSTISGNLAEADYGYGGGIAATSYLSLISTLVENNQAITQSALNLGYGGGGIWGEGTLIITQSTISGNSTTGYNAHGGGISTSNGSVEIRQSTITGNHAGGLGSIGGGVYQGYLSDNFPFTLSNSIVAGNTAASEYPDLNPNPQSNVAINYSLIGNTDGLPLSVLFSDDFESYGNTAGMQTVWGASGAATLDTGFGNLGNSAFHPGGTVNQVTIDPVVPTADNVLVYSVDIYDDGTSANKRMTAGLRSSATANIFEMGMYNAPSHYAFRYVLPGASWVAFSNIVDDLGSPITNAPVAGWHTFQVVLDGSNATFTLDLNGDGNINATAIVPVAFNIASPIDTIRLSTGLSSTGGGAHFDNYLLEKVDFNLIGTGNILNQPALLGPLVDNGGPTLTHALLLGSPAIDAGDPSIVFDPGAFDQRGTGFSRVVGGRIDIGAFEFQPIETIPGNYDEDEDVDGRDFLAWQRGESPDPLSSEDLELWQAEYGTGGLSSIHNDWPQYLALVRDETAELSDFELRNAAVANLSGVMAYSSHDWSYDTVEQRYVEEVDQAIIIWDTPAILPIQPSMHSVDSFGDLVVRRAELGRFNVDSFEAE
jgi:hypothetical protein